MTIGVSGTAKAPHGVEADFVVEPANSEVAERARRLREAVDRSGGPSAVATRAGMHVTTLNRYRTGRDMPASTLARLADVTQVSADWLLRGYGTAEIGEALKVVAPALELPGFVVVPRYDVRAGAGPGVVNPAEQVINHLAISEDYVRRVLRRQPKHMAVLEALGDSMEPTIRDGDVMMIDVSITEARASSVYVLRLGEDLMVKRLQRMFNGDIRIISDNERYGEEVITPSERTPLHIVGEVVWLGGAMRTKP